MAAMLAARNPDKVRSLMLAGAPVDTHAGRGPLVQMVKESPMSSYEDLVVPGGHVGSSWAHVFQRSLARSRGLDRRARRPIEARAT